MKPPQIPTTARIHTKNTHALHKQTEKNCNKAQMPQGNNLMKANYEVRVLGFADAHSGAMICSISSPKFDLNGC
jgi:hypothetical protein